MAVGKYTLPICDGCKLPWLPVGWRQDSDPRSTETWSGKPLRCGKCKSIGWDREYAKQMRDGSSSNGRTAGFDPADAGSSPAEPTILDRGFTLASNEDRKIISELIQEVEEHNGSRTPEPTSPSLRRRCKHRMTECSICFPKEAA